MEVFRINIKPQTEIERHQAFQRSLDQCPLCDHKLNLEVIHGVALDQIQEKAHCPCCNAQIRTETHFVH